MTDNQLLADLDEFVRLTKAVSDEAEGDPYAAPVARLMERAAEALRACDRDLATALDALRQIGGTRDLEYARTRARQAVQALASVVSPPTSPEDQSTVPDGT